MPEVIKIEKLVHGGQGIGTLADGRRVFVWNALPGEEVEVRLTKCKNKLAEGVATSVITASEDRETPHDEAYLSTSPWQIMTYQAENQHKQAILTETLQREHVQYDHGVGFNTASEPWHYRNKMEYSFYGDDDGLHLALYNRGTHSKCIVEGSSIAMSQIDVTAQAIVAVLNQRSIRGSQLKTVIVRANQSGNTVAALFVKDELFPEIPELEGLCQGITVCYSTPKSPASVLTRQLYAYGDTHLTDSIAGHSITYDAHSFFQVYIPLFEQALAAIKTAVGKQPYVDMYSGVGTIGIALGGPATLVEIDANNCQKALLNASGSRCRVVQASAETALNYIDSQHILIVDPPRAGLHAAVVDRILEVRPPKVVYLSCNPITQARDLAKLQAAYTITSIEGYNFFPRTPHIESLAVLEAN